MSNYIKDVDATLDFAFDWKPLTHGFPGAKSDWLATGETISSYVITVPTGITLETEGDYAQSESDGKITYWLTGGTAKTWYTVACKITTDSSPARIDERTMHVHVYNR
jgi:hypothetical protein